MKNLYLIVDGQTVGEPIQTALTLQTEIGNDKETFTIFAKANGFEFNYAKQVFHAQNGEITPMNTAAPSPKFRFVQYLAEDGGEGVDYILANGTVYRVKSDNTVHRVEQAGDSDETEFLVGDISTKYEILKAAEIARLELTDTVEVPRQLNFKLNPAFEETHNFDGSLKETVLEDLGRPDMERLDPPIETGDAIVMLDGRKGDSEEE